MGLCLSLGEHYVLIQGTKGAIKLDLFNCKGTLKVDGKETYFLIHESQEEDDDRTRIYHSTEMDGAIAMVNQERLHMLSSVIDKEMKYLHDIMNGAPVSKEFEKLLTGEAALEAIASADACTRSINEDRKVKLSEIMG
mgnify:CR=1 FL=1